MTEQKRKFLQETRFEDDYDADKTTEEIENRRKLREKYPQWRSDS